MRSRTLIGAGAGVLLALAAVAPVAAQQDEMLFEVASSGELELAGQTRLLRTG